MDQDKSAPPAHILMPLYNTNKYVADAIISVLNQDYPHCKLFILDDGSTDGSFEIAEKFAKEKPDKIFLRRLPERKGITHARGALLKWSKEYDAQAYIFWLDSDDQYTKTSFVARVLEQMQKTHADICLFNFSVVYEDEKQKINAQGLLKDQRNLEEILTQIVSSPSGVLAPLELTKLPSSLGWIKCYAPTVTFPEPEHYPFQDFVYMATLLEAHLITALDPSFRPIQYTRRSSSICGQRTPENFTLHLPAQLRKFFDVVLEQSAGTKTHSQKLNVAQEFVISKLDQYGDLLKALVEAKSHPGIDEEVRRIYMQKEEELKSYMEDCTLRGALKNREDPPLRHTRGEGFSRFIQQSLLKGRGFVNCF